MTRLRAEIEKCRISGGSDDLAFDIKKLQQVPLLASACAEVLRLYVATAMARTPERADFKLGDWTIPKGKHMIFSTYDAHRDSDAFAMYMGSDDDFRPLDTFWAERFLVNRGQRQQSRQASSPEEPGCVDKESKAEVSFDGLDGAYIPYGGGVSICPGRHYAKQKMLSSFAILCMAFDFELCMEKGTEVRADLSFWGTGTLRPQIDVPFRLRRRV